MSLPKIKPQAKHVLVTGGCGFIGSHLVEKLLENNHRVTVIDNLSTGKRNNLNGAAHHPHLRFIIEDITSYDKIYPFFRNQEWVFHLAALADIVPSIDHPDRYYNTNVSGTFNVLEACRKAKVKRFIYTASSSCYGIPNQYPTSEEAPLQPQYPYALTKALGEQLVHHWGKVYDLDVVSLRLFNVYGPRARSTGQYGAVFGIFLKQKLANQPLTVVGDGSQSRDFIYVSDVVRAFILAAQSPARNQIFNVGFGKSSSINELVKYLNHPSTHIPKRPAEPDCTLADISKIKKVLKWVPKVSFQKGVSKMLKDIDIWKNAPLWTPEMIQEATRSWFKYLAK